MRTAETCVAEGTISMAQGKFLQAIQLFKQAIHLEPHHVPAHNDLGLAYLRNNQLEEAVQTFKRTLELNPQLANVYSNLGHAYRLKQQNEKAIQSYNAALKINPKLSEVYDELGMLSWKNQQNQQKAFENFNKALQLDECNLSALNNLTELYLAQNKKQEALKLNERAIKVSPHNHTAIGLKHALKQ